MHGFWPDKDDDPDGGGQWYEGIVEGVDYVERTVNILYEDGDRDDSVPWAYTRILDDIPDSDDSSSSSNHSLNPTWVRCIQCARILPGLRNEAREEAQVYCIPCHTQNLSLIHI